MKEIVTSSDTRQDEFVKLSQKLESVGLTEDDYSTALQAIKEGDIAVLRQINILAEARMEQRGRLFVPVTTQKLYQNPDTKEYKPSRQDLHESIIEKLLSRVEPSEHPDFHIMAGPPGVGKTTGLIRYQKSANAILTDPTLIQMELDPGFDENNYVRVMETIHESFDIAELLIKKAFARRLSITSESTLQNLPWVTESLSYASQHGYESHIMFFHKPLEDCLADAIEKRKRPISLNYLFKSIQGYENLSFLDRLPELKVTFIDKSILDEWRVIYDRTDGSLGSRDEFAAIKKSVDVFKPLVIK